MKYVSTRGGDPVSLDEALVRGIAEDGGLFMPTELPQFTHDDLASAGSLQEVAGLVLRPFFAGSKLAADLADIIAETFYFPVPLTRLNDNGARLELLELYHGPTAAFKDFGAGFLAACIARLNSDPVPLTILVATSGDTGGAVAAAFNERPGIQVAILFPDGRVSARQAQQLSCWGPNVLSLAVQGSFDDCQALVKQAFADTDLRDSFRFSSANSINIGRLLPQCIYYADAARRHMAETGEIPGFIVPSGNLGNAFACIMARQMGIPIGPVLLATNANRMIPDFLHGAPWTDRDTIETHASAMDVGNASNMERLRSLFGDAATIAAEVSAASVDDAAIEEQIRLNKVDFDLATCPHTATATALWRRLTDQEKRATDWIAVATAHPAKFEQIVEPLIGESIALPDELERILSLPSRAIKVGANLDKLAAALRENFAT